MSLASLIPGLGPVRAAIKGALVVGLIAGGAWLGAWARSLNEPARIAAAAKPLCDAAAVRAKLTALQSAVAEERQARQWREDVNAQLGIEITALQEKLKEKFDATADKDRVCVPAGAQWLRR